MWNPYRFVETLAFFGEVPFLGNLAWLQSMFGLDLPAAPEGPLLPLDPAVVLIGNADHAQLLQALAALGVPVRSIPEVPSGGWVNTRLVLVDGEEGVSAPDLSVDLSVLLAQLQDQSASVARPLLDFTQTDAEQMALVWGAVDDGVMGGVSQSGMTLGASRWGRFAGIVSTANSGGFASVRTRNFEPPFDLTGWQGIRLRVRGDGQRYKLILRGRQDWDSLAYCASFDTTAAHGETQVDLPFAALQATFRARTLPNEPPLDLSCVRALQIMLSKFEYDGALNPQFRAGPFALEIAAIAVYRPALNPTLVAIAHTPDQATAYEAQLSESGVPYRVVMAP